MFHWICPECGQEIAPTARECPVCDPVAGAAEPALVGVVETPTAFPTLKNQPTPLVVQARHESTLTAPTDPILPQLEGSSHAETLAVLTAGLELPSLPSPPQPPGVQNRLRMEVPAVPPALRTLLASLEPASRPSPVAVPPAAPAQE